MTKFTPLGGLLGVACFGLLTLPGCEAAKVDTSKIESSLSEIQANQKTILAKLDDMEKKIGAAAAAAPAKPKPQAGRPDPDETYKVDIADSEPYKGAKDALVTIVEWSDFQ